MKNCISVVLILILGLQILQGQEVKTDKVRFRVNNLPQTESPSLEIDDKAPSIGILSPKAVRGGLLESEIAEINLIGQVNDASEINMVSVDSRIVQVNRKGIFTTKIELKNGENRIVVSAIDEHNNVGEETITIVYSPAEIPLATRIVDGSVYYALIIGINSYLDPAIQSLDNPIQDAQKLYNVLTSSYTFESENIQFLKDARRTDIFYALDHLSRVVTDNDNLLIFYAGHGTFDDEANIGYWLPSDARKISKADWFRNSTLADYLKEINTRHTLLITDACFGGSIFKMRAAFSDASPDIENLYETPSRKAMTSGALTEVPDESSFTAFLINRLENNKKPYLSSEQLFSSFRTAVANNSDTEPQFGEIRNVGDEGGDFIFVKRK